jgi:hypothetical protein
MLIGVTIQSDSTGGDIYFSPWFPRGGNSAVFACEMIACADTTNDIDTFTVQVQTKNAEDSDMDAVDLLVSPQSIGLGTDEGVTSFSAGAKLSDTGNQGMKALVRFKYMVKAKADGRAWVHFRMLNPAWRSN